MFRVAILSFWHVHARDYALEAEKHPGVVITAVWDEEKNRGRMEASKRGVPFHDDLDDLLSREDVDGVIVTTPTVAHREVIPAAATAGKHGTEGSLLYHPSGGLRTRRRDAEQWSDMRVPADGRSPFVRWVDLSSEGRTDPENVRAALELSALAEAANLSAGEGRLVRPGDLP